MSERFQEECCCLGLITVSNNLILLLMLKTSSFFLIFFFLMACNSSSDIKALTKENVQKGETLFQNVGCTTCHSVSGEVRYGPPLNVIFNKNVEVIHDGKERTIKVDRDYIERSIKDPESDKVLEFRSKKMTKPELSQEDIDYIVDYLIYINTK